MFLLKWWPEKTESQSLCCKVTNKPPVCRALLLKKIDADSENDMKRTRCTEQKPVGSLRFFHRP